MDICKLCTRASKKISFEMGSRGLSREYNRDGTDVGIEKSR